MYSNILVSAITSLLVSGLVSYIAYEYWPRLRRRRLHWRIELEEMEKHGARASCRVFNGGLFTLEKARAYLTVDHFIGDIIDRPDGKRAFITKNEPTTLAEGQLCWSVRASSKNPPEIDIYAGERQSLALVEISASGILIPSEDGWDESRVFLRRKQYKGKLKIVSKDIVAREFGLTINPEDNKLPIRVDPL